MTVRFIEPRRDDPRLGQDRRYRMVINGRDVDAASGKTIKRESSVHEGLVVGEWPEASREDVETAILAARHAFDQGPWPRMSGKERASYLYKISELIKQNAEELALMESLEVGKTLAGARGEMQHCADLWHFAAGLVRGLEGTTHNEIGPDALGLVLREPIGVVGIVTPCNYPLVIGSSACHGPSVPAAPSSSSRVSSPPARPSASASWPERPGFLTASSMSSQATATPPARSSPNIP